MKNKFTPGPWKVSDREMKKNEHGALGIDIDFKKYTLSNATVWCLDDEPSEEEKANARLIAAAPELLDVCQTFPGFNAISHAPELLAEWTVKLVNAIAKATGETINS